MRLPLAVALVALLVSGCLSHGPSTPAANTTATNVTTAGLALRPGQNATEVMMGEMPHVHDYWVGRERVTLFDGDIDPGAPDPNDVFATTLVHHEAKVGGIEWHLPDGQIVYEGTGQMDLTASWTDAKTTGVSMAYQAASDEQMRSPPVVLTNGKVVSVPVTPDMTDMPHSHSSRWGFHFQPDAQPGTMLAPFHLKVEIVKMRDVGLFPAHPQLFGTAHEKIINDKSYSFTESSYVTRVPQLLQNGDFSEKIVTPTDIVPMEAQWLRAEVDITEASSTPGQVADVNFFYHGANTTYLGHPSWLPTAGNFASKHLQWDIPVTMEMTDSPYAKTSQWRFFVEPSVVLADGTPKMGGVTDVKISYHLKITVFDHVPDGATASKDEFSKGGN